MVAGLLFGELTARAVHVGRECDIAQRREVAGASAYKIVDPQRGVHNQHRRVQSSAGRSRDLAFQPKAVVFVGEILRSAHDFRW